METEQNSKILKNTLLLCTSIVITILLAELLVRIIVPQDKKIIWLEMHPDGFMMNQNGGEAFQEFKDQRTEYLFTKNRTRGIDPDPTGTTILTIGDSFTFGLFLKEEDTYVSLLDNEFDSTSFVNGGVGGSGLADWPGWLEHYGEAISPDYLIMFLNYDDVDRALSKNLYVLSPDDSIMTESQRWRPNEFMFALNKMSWYRWLQAHSELSNLIIKILWRKSYFKDVTHNFDPEKTEVPIPEISDLIPASDYSLKLALGITEKINSWCKSNNCTFILATTGYSAPDNESPHTYRFYTWLKEHKSELEYPFYDIRDCVYDSVDGDMNSITIPDDTHPNKQGAATIAGCTSSWLTPILYPSNTTTVTN